MESNRPDQRQDEVAEKTGRTKPVVKFKLITIPLDAIGGLLKKLFGGSTR